jgi:shikimate dehydrogenase
MSAPPYPVHTFGELENWPTQPPSLALIGLPVMHSLSPAMQNPALAALAKSDARFATWRYHKFEIAPAELARALPLFHARGFVGLNATQPHKEALLDHAESADPFARAAGAANTLVRTPTGWRAFNTDAPGLADALRVDFGCSLAGTHVILLGAGGAARGAAVQCLREHVASLSIGNRGTERLENLLAHLAPLAGDIPLRGFSFENPPADLPRDALVINATTVGLRATDPAPIDLTRLPSPARVYDMIYNPPRTALLGQAAALGLPHANGVSMLVHQGVRAFTLWTGAAAPVEVMDRAARAALAP